MGLILSPHLMSRQRPMKNNLSKRSRPSCLVAFISHTMVASKGWLVSRQKIIFSSIITAVYRLWAAACEADAMRASFANSLHRSRPCSSMAIQKPLPALIYLLDASCKTAKLIPKISAGLSALQKKTFFSPNLSRLATAAKGCRIGERIAVYQCQDGSLSRAEFFTHDEDRGYLLRRLHDMAERFRVLFTDSEFRRLFPLIQSVARDQLCLF